FGSIETNRYSVENIITSEQDFELVNDGRLITQFDYTDEYATGNALEAGATYQYEIRPFYPDTYGEDSFITSETVTLQDLPLEVTSLPTDTYVSIKWANDDFNLLDFGYDSLEVYRDGNYLSTVYKEDGFIDESAVMGTTHTYEIRLFRDNRVHLEKSIQTTLAPNGTVEGYLISRIEDIVIKEETFSLRSDQKLLELASDPTGQFQRPGIEYGLSETFNSANAGDGSITLKKSNPISKDNFIVKDKGYSISRVSNLLAADSTVVTADGELLTFKLELTEKGIEDLKTGENWKDHWMNVYINDTLKKIIVNPFDNHPHPEEMVGMQYIDSLSKRPTDEFTFKL
ncbi:MAG: hypothetical protein AAFY41_18630, partial [Bacteroidota bacterium]